LVSSHFLKILSFVFISDNPSLSTILDVGSAVVTVDLSSREHLKSIDVPIWRARASTRLFVAKTEAAVLSRLLFNEDLAPLGATNADDKGKEAEVETKEGGEARTETEGHATVSEPMKE
jgi:hypothetical protein